MLGDERGRDAILRNERQACGGTPFYQRPGPRHRPATKGAHEWSAATKAGCAGWNPLRPEGGLVQRKRRYAVSSRPDGLPDFDALWNYDQPAETERAFREALARTEAAALLGYRLELLTQIARTQGLQRRFDE